MKKTIEDVAAFKEALKQLQHGDKDTTEIKEENMKKTVKTDETHGTFEFDDRSTIKEVATFEEFIKQMQLSSTVELTTNSPSNTERPRIFDAAEIYVGLVHYMLLLRIDAYEKIGSDIIGISADLRAKYMIEFKEEMTYDRMSK